MVNFSMMFFKSLDFGDIMICLSHLDDLSQLLQPEHAELWCSPLLLGSGLALLRSACAELVTAAQLNPQVGVWQLAASHIKEAIDFFMKKSSKNSEESVLQFVNGQIAVTFTSGYQWLYQLYHS